ncbi:hypothetical protein RBB50_002279 [Rhinocladiella similis]
MHEGAEAVDNSCERSPRSSTAACAQKRTDPKSRPATSSTTTTETLKSNMASTERHLSEVLSQVSELPSFAASPVKSNTTKASSATSSSSLSGASFSSTTASASAAGLSSQERAALDYVDHVFSNHISLLKEYNEIKDVAMGMLSILAEKQGRRLAEVMEDHGLTEDD